MNALDFNKVLMGGSGAPRARFENHGDTVTGRILAISEPYQEREYDQNNPGGGAPKFFPKSGDPIMTFNLDLATDMRDPAIENDDGTRRVYMDGARIKKAVAMAVRSAGQSGLAVGGHLSITYTGDQTPGDKRSGKIYAVQYTAAAPANSVLMGEQAPPPVPQPAAAAQATPTPPAADADPTARLRAAGFTEEQIAAATAAGISLT